MQGDTSDPLRHQDTLYSATLEPKAWFIVDTSGSGTIVKGSDAGALVARNSAGNVTLTLSSPIGGAAGHIGVLATCASG